ncbi:MAG: 2-C-methyl-D-erythritol 2,4-cyclodiphosphate synthase [Pyrinomonadaceae bacterium]
MRIGFGTDIHRLVAGRPLVVGGVVIESDLGADGHSDADVLMHALTDALLGSLALGDIGTHFPNNEDRWKNADSTEFLIFAADLLKTNGYSVTNVDTVVNLENPKLRPYIDKMRTNIASALQIDRERVSVKAKTSESVDAVGECRAISAEAIVLVSRIA